MFSTRTISVTHRRECENVKHYTVHDNYNIMCETLDTYFTKPYEQIFETVDFTTDDEESESEDKNSGKSSETSKSRRISTSLIFNVLY